MRLGWKKLWTNIGAILLKQEAKSTLEKKRVDAYPCAEVPSLRLKKKRVPTQSVIFASQANGTTRLNRWARPEPRSHFSAHFFSHDTQTHLLQCWRQLSARRETQRALLPPGREPICDRNTAVVWRRPLLPQNQRRRQQQRPCPQPRPILSSGRQPAARSAECCGEDGLQAARAQLEVSFARAYLHCQLGPVLRRDHAGSWFSRRFLVLS